MHVHLQDFLSYISSEKGLTKNTREAYGRDLSYFINFLEKKGIDRLESVHQEHLVDFLILLKERGYATSTISRALISLKVFFRFLKREGIVSINISLYLESPRLWQLIPEVLSQEEVEILLEQPDPDTAVGSRDRAILEVLYGSGLRVSEVCSLGIYDVDDHFIRVMGKGRKERIVPIGAQAIKAIDHYLARYRCEFENEDSKVLFLTKKGAPIDRFLVWKMIKDYGKQGGILKNISPHTLRHSFATHLLDNGAELRIIQEMLGHASISSTDRYTHISKTKLQEAFKKFHPNYSGAHEV